MGEDEARYDHNREVGVEAVLVGRNVGWDCRSAMGEEQMVDAGFSSSIRELVCYSNVLLDQTTVCLEETKLQSGGGNGSGLLQLLNNPVALERERVQLRVRMNL